MDSYRIFRIFLLALLATGAPLAAQTVDTQSVTITYNGSSSANTATVHVTNASNVTARIGKNLDSTGTLVTSAGNTPGVFVQNVSDSANGALVNIGTDSNVLGALSRRGATTYTGATLLISATGCTDCIAVALTLQITNGGGITITYNGAPISNSGISLFVGTGGSTSAQLTLTSANPTAFQASSSPGWLTLSTTAGQLTGSTVLTLFANAAGLPNGPNTGSLQISAGGITTNITVTLNVGTGSGLTISPNPMNFSYVTSTSSFPQGQTQNLTISGSTGTYTATAVSSPQWLLVGSSTSVSGIAASQPLAVSVNPAVLNLSVATTYQGTVNITTSDGLSGTLTVNLTVSATSTSGGTGTLTFTVAASGAAAPPAQQITISGSGQYTAFAGTNNCGQGWIQVTPSSGTLSSVATNLSVQVFPGTIGAGTCTGTISISTTGLLSTGVNFQTVNVTMQIGSLTGGTGGAVASPTALTFNLPSGASQTQTFIVNGDGSAFTAQAIGTFTVFPLNGTTPAVLTVSANSTNGSGSITVNSSLGSLSVPITINVLGGNVLTANPASLSYLYTPGNPIPNQNLFINASQDSSGNNLSFSISSAPSFISYSTPPPTTPAAIGVAVNTAQLNPGFNSGNIVLTSNSSAANPTLTIPVTVLAPGATTGLVASPNPVNLSAQQFGGPVSAQVSLTGLTGTFTATATSMGNWLSVSPNSGNSPGTITITATPTTLGAQATAYPGTVTVTANNGTTVNIQVNLTVSTSGAATPVLQVNPLSLTFNYRTGDPAPAAQNVQVVTVNGSTSYSATTNANWITVTPTSGSTPLTVAISVNPALLTQPTQTGTVTISAAGASSSPQTVSVTANVTTPPSLTLSAGSTTFTYRTGDPTPQTQTIQVGSTTGAALPFTISVGNAPWLSVTPGSGFTTSNLTLAVDPSKVQVGNYSVTVTVNSTAAASTSFMVNFNVSAPLPTILEVRNGASNQPGPISPGLVIVIPGTFIGPDTPASFVLNGDVLATTVGNTRVRVGGYLSPIVFASSTLVAAIVPYEIAGKTSTFVEVQYLGQGSNAITVQVAATTPAIFTPDSQALPGPAPVNGAVLNPDGSVNSASNTTAVGQTVTVVATGAGQTVPAGIDGKLNDDPTAIPQPVQVVTASINATPAVVQTYAGIPGLPAGVIQVAVTVSPGNTTGDLVLHIGGNDSQAGVTVFIQ
jgi:uncharacterized protein (TIGR03437 family)